MRIIDKQVDFYDYVQGICSDHSVVFDRTDSFILSKKVMCDFITWSPFRQHDDTFLLLQVCNTLWLFCLHVTKYDEYGHPADYTICLISKWKNYTLKRVLIRLSEICFSRHMSSEIGIFYRDKSSHGFICDIARAQEKSSMLIQAVDSGDVKFVSELDRCRVEIAGNQYEWRHIPIIKQSGMAPFIDPLEIFLAIDEYFCLEKQAVERTESQGITDKEKVINHGFDVKTSFRGKNKTSIV